MRSKNDIINRLKDLVVPGRVKIRMLEQGLAEQREQFNQMERTLPQALNFLREGMVDSQARLTVMEHRLPISLKFLQEKYEAQRECLADAQNAAWKGLDELEGQLRIARDAVAEELGSLQKHITGLEEQLKLTHHGIEGQFHGIAHHFPDIAGQFGALQKNLAAQMKYVSGLEARLQVTHQGIEKQFGSVRNEFGILLQSIKPNVGALQGHLGSLQGQFEARVRQLVEMKYEVKFERNRIDYVLADQEGVLDEMEAFHHARATPEYQAVFTAENPLVSIIVATAHRPDLLIDRCLASIQGQTYQNLQVLVMGDHCIDSTPKRVAALNDDRITFHNLPKRGPYPPPGRDRWCVAGSYPTNAAFPLCRGQFVTHLDDDDDFYPDRIETMVRTIQETKADILYHPYWFEEENGCWHILGNGNFESGQIGTDTIFYHHYLNRIPEDVFAYRMREPNDWNRLRKIAMLRPHKHFVNRPLVRHYFGRNPPPFVAQQGETFTH